MKAYMVGIDVYIVVDNIPYIYLFGKWTRSSIFESGEHFVSCGPTELPLDMSNFYIRNYDNTRRTTSNPN